MSFVMPPLSPALSELWVLGMICIILLLDLVLTDRQRIVTYLLAQLTAVGVVVISFGMLQSEAVVTFSGHFVLDGLAALLKLAASVVMVAIFLYSRDYLQQRGLFSGEFYTLALAALLGMMVIISANSLLTLYLGLELMSLSLYALVALQRDSALASEAAMKYFVLGAMASAMLLYGMSLLYGLTGTLHLNDMSAVLLAADPQQKALIFGLVFVLVGVAFKLGAVPFHMWVPDVYHGAPTAITMLVSSAPKLAAFALLMRLIVEGLGPLQLHWQPMIVILAVLSIVAGNLIAIAQSNLKRMFAYSGISHIGFLLLGVVALTPEGYAAALYYAIVYAMMGMAGFGILILLSRRGFEAEQLSDLAGLHQRHPGYALMVLFILFSMAGVPPFLGFWAKLAVLQSVVAVGMVGLAVVAVIFSVIGAFYYLRVIKVVYFDAPTETTPLEPVADLRLVFVFNGLLILGLGLMPDGLLRLCQAALS